MQLTHASYMNVNNPLQNAKRYIALNKTGVFV